jgi:peptidoglycan/LPS O-acetylase OafA/YrhL
LKKQSPWMQEASFAAFDQIAVGGILYFSRERWKVGLEQRPWLCWGLLLSGLGLCLGFYVKNSIASGWEYVLVPTFLSLGCALVILGGLHLSLLNSSGAAFLSWPGKLSYGCYLWNPSLIFILMPFLVRIGGLEALLFLFLFVWIFAFVSYTYFEMPMNNRIRAAFKLKPSRSL